MKTGQLGEPLKVFMLGWEFPPFISGGLGTACYGLTKAMDLLGVRITFVLPRAVAGQVATHVRLLTPESGTTYRYPQTAFRHVRFLAIPAYMQPYGRPETRQLRLQRILQEKGLEHVRTPVGNIQLTPEAVRYAGDMFTQVQRYAAMVAELAAEGDFDLIHAHDWMTFPAAIAAAVVTGKPMIVHVHSTEFDRSGEYVNQRIYDIERAGMERADKVITVSYYTRNIIISRYGIAPEKVEVVYNGVEGNGGWPLASTGIKQDEKIVLFLGRITMQKGPEYFLLAAKKVLEVMNGVKFVMAGSGDLMHKAVSMAAELGIGHKVLFTGFLHGEQVRQIYRMADVYVMPSVSEPFGIAPLEALENDVPVIISKQSGVAEILRHALKVDFWDVNEIANKIVAILRYPALRTTLRDYGNFEVKKLRWQDSARRCIRVYQQMLVPV